MSTISAIMMAQLIEQKKKEKESEPAPGVIKRRENEYGRVFCNN